eukprot:gnl/TRDRNA2_/TRDRNA2_29018_c0_seq2.p1 gnl/TRDRNA2_/TRDRNA2_29018_c0~~gnl/TRDRNA2_/TRDRNA2_29018_c0_seq2.p1  ORF type:complete len:372 (-),score=56.91 gnl/TRDRNA2_/TRDRNA2_29018_c0_seq2:74-1189(-)
MDQAAPAQIVALIASHVPSEVRLAALRLSLDSLLAQNDPPDALLLSISYAHPICSSELEALRDSLAERAKAAGIAHTRVLLTSGQVRQFVHLQSLAAVDLEQASDSCGWWTVFGDDDDLWHPRRVGTYRTAARHCSHNAMSLLAPLRCRAASGTPADIGDVDRLLAEGKATLERDGHGPEYIDYAVRLDSLRGFFDRVPQPLLSVKYADLALVAYLESLDAVDRTAVVPEDGCWMYFYSESLQPALARGDAQMTTALLCSAGLSSHASTAIRPSASDWAHAEDGCKELASAQAGITKQDLAVVAAHCREWVSLQQPWRMLHRLCRRGMDSSTLPHGRGDCSKHVSCLSARSSDCHAQKKLQKLLDTLMEAL